MQARESGNESLQVLTAVVASESGTSGIGVATVGGPSTTITHLREQAVGSVDQLYLHAILRALQLGHRLGAENVSVLCPHDTAVKLVNREISMEPGSNLGPACVRIRALMHTFRQSDVVLVTKSRVEPARRLAASAAGVPVRGGEPQNGLFAR